MTVAGLRKGDPEVLDELLQRYGQELQDVAYLILRDASEAEDVAADTLLQALKRGQSLRDGAALRPWLLRIATNLSLSRRRRGARVAFVSVVPDLPAPGGTDVAQHADMMQALGRLPSRTRAAIVLHYHADLSVDAVATAMGTSPNTVRTQLRRGLADLRSQLADNVNGTPTAEVRHA